MADYKPGTVAVATVRGVPDVRVMRCEAGRFKWFSADGVAENRLHTEDDVTDVRPLVVLDMEDFGGAERAAEALRLCPSRGSVSLALAHAIEAQARPAIEEPTGLGAVVEDDQGDRITRYCDASDDGAWIGEDGRSWDWGALSPVRVLSEGWSE